jgi:hypothetical protein
VFPAGQPDRPVIERVVSEPRCAVDPGALSEGRYLWSATPLDGGGRPLGAPSVNKLELAYDNARNTLAITHPRPDQAVSGSAVDVRGEAPLGAKLFVNGTPAAVDAKGRFALKVSGSPPVLVFRLVGRDGSESYWTRNLSRGR